ncbi:hypothetical protein ES676_09645 [Bizionia saleffrena]|uniref:Uncharacterized protein n=1 Tax=Bizionia saleffrena TaxID=291189 RepID=A0A8H2LG13_9FLAO|nr:hypothetical protein [Bizionia saleffrena]TYB73011.1 hypothetical protein ES676_09645 [Bizionia saleffrena]
MNRLAFIIMPLLIFAMTIMIKLVIISFSTPKLRLSKNIKYDLKKAIKLDGDYSDLKLIFDKKERLDIRNNTIKNQDLYDFNADLSFVLEDM